MRHPVPAVLTTIALALTAVGVSTTATAMTITTNATTVAATIPATEQAAMMLPPLYGPSPSTGIPFSTPDLPPGVLRYDPTAPVAEAAPVVYGQGSPVTRAELVAKTTSGPLGRDVEARLATLPTPSGDDVALEVTRSVSTAISEAGLPGIVSMAYDDATTVVTVPDEAAAQQVQALTETLPVRVVVDPTQAAVTAVYEAVLQAAGMPVDNLRHVVRPEDVVVVDDYTWPGHVIVSYQADGGGFTERQWATLVELGALYPAVLAVTTELTTEPRGCSNAASGRNDGVVNTSCDTPGLGGSRITSSDGETCTMGPRLYDPSGTAYVATAGHCAPSEPLSPSAADREIRSNWSFGRNGAKRLGSSTKNYLSPDGSSAHGSDYRDVQLIEIDPEQVAGSVVRRGPAGFLSPHPLTSVQSVIAVNQPTCYVGAAKTYPASCGRVTRRDLVVAIPGRAHVDAPPGAIRNGAVPALVTVTSIPNPNPGDSGAPVFDGTELQGVLYGGVGSATTQHMAFTELSGERLNHLRVDYYDRTHAQYTAVSNASNQNVAALNGGALGYGRLWWGFPDAGGGRTTVKQTRLGDGKYRYDITWNAGLSQYNNTRSGTARLAVGCVEDSSGVIGWREFSHLDLTTSAPNTNHIVSNKRASIVVSGPACAKTQVRYTATILRTRHGAKPPYTSSPAGSPQTWVSTNNMAKSTVTRAFAPSYAP